MNTKYLPILPSVILNLIQDLLNRFRIRTCTTCRTLRPSVFKYGMTTVILIVMVGIFLFVSPSKAFAATLCWAGTGSGAGANWSVAGNWITTAGAVSGAAPGSSDTATFDPSKTVCTGGTPTNTASTVDASFAGTVSGVAIKSGYTGTITQSHDLTMSGTAGFVQASTGSIWNASGGSNAFTIDNAGAAPFTLSAGTFQASTGTLTYKPGAAASWDTTGGTFTPGSGSVLLVTNGAGMTMTVNSSTTFNNLQISNATDPQSTYSIASGKNPVVNGTLTVSHNTAGSNPCSIAGSGSIHARGNITLSGAGCAGQAPITIDNSTGGNQTLQGDSGQAAGVESKIPGMIINRTSEAGSTLTLQNSFRVDGDFTYTAGTLTTTGSTVIFDGCHTCTLNITGSVSLANVKFNSGSGEQTTYPIASGTNLTVTGTLTMDNTGGQPSVINGTGTITAQGDISTANNGGSGTVAITLSGTATQTVTSSGSSLPAGTVTFNKSSGTITLAAAWGLTTAGQDLLVQSGSSQTLSGAFTLTVNDVTTISGALTQTTSTISSGTFTISTGGTWSNTSTGDITIGSGGLSNSGTLTLDGTSAGCGGADAIAITSSSSPTQRSWTGTGAFTLYDVAITDQTTSLGLTAYSSTNNGNNSGFTFISSCPSSLPSSSASFWKFDEGQGTTTSDSSTGNSFPRANGTLSGSTAPSWQTEDLCISGKCLFFNGSTAYVNIPTNVVNVQSVAMWVRPNNFTAAQALIDLDSETHTHTVTVAITTGQITANGFSSPTYYINGVAGNRTLIANQWNYVEITTATPFTTGTTTIGKSNTTFFQGFIDEVRAFNTARTAQQVKSDYVGRGASVGANEQASNPINNNPAALSNGLVGGWRMDDAPTTINTASIVQRTTGAGTTPKVCYSAVPNRCDSDTFGSNVTAGNGLVLVVWGWMNGSDPTISSVTEGAAGSAFTAAIARTSNSTHEYIAIYYLANATGGASDFARINFSSTVDEVQMVAYEVSGVPTDSTIFTAGQSTTNTGDSYTPSTGTVTANSTGQLAFGVFGDDHGGNPTSNVTNTSSGWTNGGVRNNGSVEVVGANDFKASTSLAGTSVSDSWSYTGTQGIWISGVAVFNSSTSANTSTVDSSGNTNTGTLNGNATYSAGKFGGGSTFDGTDDYISITDANSLDMTNLTLSAWINPTALGGAIITKATGAAGTDGYLLDTSGSKIRFCATGGCASSNTTLSTGSWQHIAVTFDGFTTRFFLNGVLDGTTTTATSVAVNAVNLRLGADSATGSDYNGKIDEARIYNRALSPADIYNLYNFAPGPVGKWELEEGSGTTANDTSSNANTGTITAGTGGYVAGKYGKAYNFDNASTKIDAGSGATLTDLKNTAGLSAEAWIYPKSSGEGGAAGGVIIGKATGPTGTPANGWEFFVTTSNALKFTSDGSTDLVRLTSSTLTLNAWSHVAVTWDGSLTATNVHIYINGSEAAYSTTTTGVALTSDATTTLIIGNDSTSADTFDGFIDNIKVYNYPRTQKQTIEDLNAGHPAPGSPIGTPVGWWKFNEGYGNSTGNAHNSGNCASTCAGTLTGTASPATATSGWTQSGKFGRALLFDGTDDYVAMPSDVNQLKITGDLSLSAWINLTSTAAQRDIICKWTNTAATSSYCLYTNSSGQLVMGISDGATITTTTETAQTLAISTWYHVVGVFSGSNSVTLYINGIQVKQNTTSIPASLGNSTTILDIGAENAGTNPMNGAIDEPKVYAGALTPDQIKLDMNNAQAQQLGAAGNNSTYQTGAANQEYCVPGDSTSCVSPVAEWKFEEGPYNGTADEVKETSGNGRHGQYQINFTKTSVPGKLGKAAYFTKSLGNWIQCSDASLPSGTSARTIETWVNPTSLGSTNTIFTYGTQTTNNANGFELINSNTIRFLGWNNDWDVTYSVPLNTWTHIVGTHDTSNTNLYVNGNLIATSTAFSAWNTTLSLCEISEGTATFDGSIDQLKIFNYVRTPAQIAWDYNKAAPVAWYKFDECTGATVHDSSGNSYTETLTVGGSGTQTAAGTCTTSGAWFNGVTGKRNYSLNLDGSDDFLTSSAFSPLATAANTTTKASWGGWFFPTRTTTAELLIDKPSEFHLQKNSSDQVFCGFGSIGAGNDGGNVAITLSTWNHIFCTYDGTNVKTYINGILRDTTAKSATITATSSILYLGEKNDASARYQGQIDDLRIFDYDLTQLQVKVIYNNGTVNFAPLTGAP